MKAILRFFAALAALFALYSIRAWFVLGGAFFGVVLLRGAYALARDCADAVRVPAVQQRLTSLGATAIGGSAQDFAKLIQSDHDKWGPVIKAAGIKGE